MWNALDGFRRAMVGMALVVSAGIPAGALDREANPTLSLPPAPPVVGYTTQPAFGSLRFTDPLALATPPGETNRLFVVEQRGRIAVIPDLTAPSRSVFLDLADRVTGGVPADERGLLGLAFHPGYETNRFFYVYYSATTNGVLHQRLSRFEADPADPGRALAASERILLSQRDEANNHNGGDLHFGPDGYLYVSLGDEGAQNDAFNNSQRIDKDFFSGILRLDVDLRPGSLPPNPHPAVFPGAYGVPPDNPWVGATSFRGASVNPTQVRTEFWAVGLRNPWRMSFDPATGQLWVGDVGGDLFEEINQVVRGGNYGWAWREGTGSGPKASAGGADPGFLPPLAQYRHVSGNMGGRSVTGGLVYRGHRLSQLYGAYVFADYVSGNLWALPAVGTGFGPMQRLTGRSGIAGFGRDPRNGDVLMADQSGDTLQRLTYSAVSTGAPLPGTLAETGAFANLNTLAPAAGVVPYELNVPFWSDGAKKRRWFAVPDPGERIGFQQDDPWVFPEGTVWVKHFELETIEGVPESARRLETRFLVRSPGGVYGLTYRWTSPPTNAVLVAEEGADEAIVVRDAGGGIVRTQLWHYPSRSECLQCHTPASGWALGFNTRQLNRDVDPGGGPENQIALLARAGYFENPPPGWNTLPALAPASDESTSVEWRVRSWLDANCSGCHQPGGTGLGAWDARARTPLALTGLVRGLLNNDRGNPDHRLVSPGSVETSMLHTRLRLDGIGRMPPLASSRLDDASAALVRRWITNDLPRWQSLPEWQTTHFGSPDVPLAARAADPDEDRARNELEYLTGTDPWVAGDAWSVALERVAAGIRLRYLHVANRSLVVEWTDTPAEGGSWRPLDVPGNRFRVPAVAVPVTIEEAASGTARYYRVRVVEL